jgi:hypothetical protein
MVAGLLLGASAYLTSHTTSDPLVQRDGLALGLGGVTAAVVGSALFLRYSLTGFLRFWMARQSFDLSLLADQLGIDLGADLSGTRGMQITRTYVRAFFDQHLRNRRQPLLYAPSPAYPEVTFCSPWA